MNGQMMPIPLLISSLLVHTERHHTTGGVTGKMQKNKLRAQFEDFRTAD